MPRGAGGPGKGNRLGSLEEYTGTGPYNASDPEVIPQVTKTLNDIRANKGGVTQSHAGNKPDKVIYFYPKGGAPVPASGTYSNGQKGIIIIEYQGKISSFMNGNYKGFTKMD